MPVTKLSLQTLGSKQFLELSDIPTNGGFPAPIGSVAYVSLAGVGSFISEIFTSVYYFSQ